MPFGQFRLECLSWSSRKISMAESVLGGRPGGYACENLWKSLTDARARGSTVDFRAIGGTGAGESQAVVPKRAPLTDERAPLDQSEEERETGVQSSSEIYRGESVEYSMLIWDQESEYGVTEIYVNE